MSSEQAIRGVELQATRSRLNALQLASDRALSEATELRAQLEASNKETGEPLTRTHRTLSYTLLAVISLPDAVYTAL